MMLSMDSGWAVVIGAAIALIASVATPWLKDSLDRKHRDAVLRKAALAGALQRISKAAPRLAQAVLVNRSLRDIMPSASASASATAAEMVSLEPATEIARAQAELGDAIFELALLLPSSDAAIELMARSLSEAMHERHFGIELGAFSSASARWFRGEISAPQALSEYERTVQRWRERTLTSRASGNTAGSTLPDSLAEGSA